MNGDYCASGVADEDKNIKTWVTLELMKHSSFHVNKKNIRVQHIFLGFNFIDAVGFL